MAFPNLLKRLFDTNGAGVTLRGDIMPFSAEAPKAGGTASAGTSNTVARGDHVHPTQTIGTASGTVSGTTKLSDATNSTSGADSGVAATPKAVKAAYDKAVEAKNAADAAASSIDPWNIFPMRVPIAVDGVTFGGSDGRRAIMPGETEAREDWILCDGGSDGKGGTVPDLRGRMIMGASDEHPAGSSGGSETHSHSISGTVGEGGAHTHGDTFSTRSAGSHSHTVSGSIGSTTLTTSQMPKHSHTIKNSCSYNINQPGSGSDATLSQGSADTTTTQTTGGSSSHSHTLSSTSTGSSGSHTHTISGSVSSGGSHTHSLSIDEDVASNIQPYYSLAYIMRCA